jgi:dinuclear metal center YbgI/SA1388 family protein
MIAAAELERLCDELLQARRFTDYCPNGLQVEGARTIRRLVSGVTASQALIDAAVADNADAILVHHGFFWKGEAAVIRGMKARRIGALLRNEISLLAYHLPLDAHAQYGNNVQLALRLGLEIDGNLDDSGVATGLLGHLPTPMRVADFAALLTQSLGRPPLVIADPDREIRTIAWCTGAAQGFIEQAHARGVDAYLTGEVSEPTVHFARENGIAFFAAGHHATERYGVQALGEYLAKVTGIEHRFIDCDNPV